MLLLVAFLLTIAYYAVLVGLDQKRKKQFALSQQIVLPTMEQLSEPMIESSPVQAISEDSIFGAMDVTVEDNIKNDIHNNTEQHIPNSTSISIDHLVQANTNNEPTLKPKLDIPKLETIPIANKPNLHQPKMK